MDDVTALVYSLMQAKDPPWEWADLARAMNTTDQRVYNWRKRRIPPEVHSRLADVLGVSLDTLAGRKPITAAPPPTNVATLTPPPDPLIREALALLEGTDHDGRVMALTAIRFALKDHRPPQANHAR